MMTNPSAYIGQTFINVERLIRRTKTPSKRVLAIPGAIALIVSVLLLGVASYFWIQIPFVKFQLQAGQCKWGPPLAGVYSPSRLKVNNRCMTVSGTVDCLM